MDLGGSQVFGDKDFERPGEVRVPLLPIISAWDRFKLVHGRPQSYRLGNAARCLTLHD